VLVGLDDPVSGQRLKLTRDTSIGRSRDNQLVVLSDSLSRRHARVIYLDGRFLLQDLGSTNGCAVNGRRVGSASVVLGNGDEIQIGKLRFRLEVVPEP
jgi:pilus assembly protein CpaF